jgi:hypothetical protein
MTLKSVSKHGAIKRKGRKVADAGERKESATFALTFASSAFKSPLTAITRLLFLDTL